jgi:tetratricopeptide (TPR) repeat protein
VRSASALTELAAAALEAAEHGRLDEAQEWARQALERADRLAVGPDRDRIAARARRALGTVQRARGELGPAEQTFLSALEAAHAGFGAASIEAAELHNDLGMTYKYTGRFADAEAAYGRVLAIFDVQPFVDPEDLAALFHNLGGLAHARHDFAAAEPLARRAIEIRSASAGPDAPSTLLDRSAHAAILPGLDRSDEAEAIYRDLLPKIEAAFGLDHPEVAVALNNLAAIVQARGAFTEAESLYRRVVDVKVARLGSASPFLALPLNNLGTVVRALSRPDEARGLYDRAAALLEGSVAADHPNLLAIRRNIERLAAAELRGDGPGSSP